MYREVRQRIQFSLLLWSSLAFAAWSSGVDTLPLASRFERLDIQHGLSQATVTSLAQDHDGYVWIGTQNGLNRYDGYNVKVFRPEDNNDNTLADNFVSALAVDEQGKLWVGTLKGLNRYNAKTATFDKIPLTPARSDGTDAILSLHLDQQNRLWAGTERGVALWQNQQLTLWPQQSADAAALLQLNITAITSDNQDQLWLGTPRGLFCISISRGEIISTGAFPIPQASVMALYFDKDGRLWVGLEHHGLLMRDATSGSWTHIPLAAYDNGITSKEIRSIAMDHQGDIWVGTQHGLNQLTLQNGQWQPAAAYYHQRHNPTSLGSGKVAAIMIGKYHSIWVGTWNGGVSRLHQTNNLFTSITPDLPIMAAARNPATIALSSHEDTVWAGTADGLFELDLPSANLSVTGDPHESLTFYSALKHDNTLLFGHTNGIKRLDLNSKLYDDVNLPDTLPSGPVRRMLAVGQLLWLAVDQFGIVVLDQQMQRIMLQQPFSRSITFIRPLAPHFVLVGSYNGLTWFDSNTGKQLYHHPLGSVSGDTATHLPAAPMAYAETPDGRRWLATNGSGLFELRHPGPVTDPSDVQFTPYSTAQGLASGQLKALELDNSGNIWLSTDIGISVFLPGSSQFHNFGALHGTLRRDYINAASTRLADGSIAFGGMDGFTLFQPQQVLAYQPQPVTTPHILDIKVNGAALRDNGLSRDATLMKVLYDDAKLIIPPTGSRSVSVNFSSREFIETEQVQFQYRLDPLTQDWVTQDASSRTASFERLPPGNYQLRLRAGLPQAGWSDEYQLSVRVLPLWWETWLARLLMLAALLGILLAAHFIRLKHLHKRQQELAWLVEERTGALEESKNKAEQTLQHLASTMQELVRTEKMAALGQLVAGVAHEVNTPLGVALTANSVVSEESRQLQQKLASGNIRRQEMDAFLQKLSQATRLLDSNLHRAAQLVSNFKQVSVDRTADNQRKFNLALYLDELLESLSLMWKTRNITISVSCPDTIVMDSYPGTIGQIITNFTQNAVVHGFKDQPSGQIRISCNQLDDKVEIVFADNGSGISNDNLQRIFDPFFTTNRHEGGTGLGLHIVYNLITQKLRGSISVASTPGEGTRFTLLLPLKV